MPTQSTKVYYSSGQYLVVMPRTLIAIGLTLLIAGGGLAIYSASTYHPTPASPCPRGDYCPEVGPNVFPIGEPVGSLIALVGAVVLIGGIVKWYRGRAGRIEADRRSSVSG
jgi:hypothetical protein